MKVLTSLAAKRLRRLMLQDGREAMNKVWKIALNVVVQPTAVQQSPLLFKVATQQGWLTAHPVIVARK